MCNYVSNADWLYNSEPRLFGCNVSSFNKFEYTQGMPNIMLGVVCQIICQYNLFLDITFLKYMKSMLKLIFVSQKLWYIACHFNVLPLINQSIEIKKKRSMYQVWHNEIRLNLQTPNNIWPSFKYWYCYAITYETNRYVLDFWNGAVFRF